MPEINETTRLRSGDRRPRAFEPQSSDVLAIDPRALTQLWSPLMPADDDCDDDEEVEHEDGYCCVGPMAIVDIQGPLQKCAHWWNSSYEEIEEQFCAALANPAVQGVLLRINSPGGVAEGVFETTRRMRAAKLASGKPVYSYADESALSAAYALATVGDEIWLPSSGMLGSIGCVMQVQDRTKFNDEMGIRVEVITSGTQKADGNPNVPLTPETIARFQAVVDAMGGQFAQLVADARSMTVDDVLALQAGQFLGAQAVPAGLANRVGSKEDCIAALKARFATAPATPAMGKPAPTGSIFGLARMGALRAAAPVSASSAPRGDTTMEQTAPAAMLAALHLEATASDADVLVSITTLASGMDQILAVAGTTSHKEAVAKIAAWKSSSERLAALEAERALEAQAAEQARLAAEAQAKEDAKVAREANGRAAIETASNEGRLDANGIQSAEQFLARDLKDEDDGLTLLSTFLRTLSPVVQTRQLAAQRPVAPPPASGAPVVGSAAAEYATKKLRMSPEEFAKSEAILRSRGLLPPAR